MVENYFFPTLTVWGQRAEDGGSLILTLVSFRCCIKSLQLPDARGRKNKFQTQHQIRKMTINQDFLVSGV